MDSSLPRIALDSCAIIDAITGKPKDPDNYGPLKEIIDRAANGKLLIVVSAASFAEVHYIRLRSDLDQETQNAMIDRWFDNPFIIKVSVDPRVGRRAANICREHNTTPIDGMIVASALTGKAETLVTSDCKNSGKKAALIDLDGKIGEPPLKIKEPKSALEQSDMFYGSEVPSDEN